MFEAALAGLPPRSRADKRPGSRRAVALVLAAICSALVLRGPVAAAPVVESAPEHTIEAAYLYNFLVYVDWPSSVPDAEAPIRIGVLGDEPVAAALTSITRNRTVRGKAIEVRQMRRDDPVAGLHLLFIARESASALARLREAAREHSVLVVTEWEAALEQGSIINFLLVGERMRFEVSLDAADTSGLSISSRLLAVAERVLQGEGK